MEDILAFIKAVCIASSDGEPFLTRRHLRLSYALLDTPDEAEEIDLPAEEELQELHERAEEVKRSDRVEEDINASKTVTEVISSIQDRLSTETQKDPEQVFAEVVRPLIEQQESALHFSDEPSSEEVDDSPISRQVERLLRDENLPLENLVPSAGAPLDGLPTLDENIKRVLLATARERRRNVALLAPKGGGKTFTMEQLAARVKAGKVPSRLEGIPILKVHSSGVRSKYAGESEKMLRKIFDKVSELPQAILFFDEFQSFVSPSGGAHVALTSELKDLLTSPRYRHLSVVVATTRQEYDQHVRTDQALERRLISVQIRTPEGEEAIEAIRQQAASFPDQERALTDEHVEEALRMARTYFSTQPPIDCALNLLDGAFTRLQFETFGESVVDGLQAEVQSQLSVDLFGSDEVGRVDELVQTLREKVVGQPHAVRQLKEAFTDTLLDLGSGSGPRNVILFAGPPGVGKTHTARIYADFIGEGRFLNLHMGEYSTPQHGLTKLIGAGPSYKRSEVGGVLTNFVRDHPSGVVLFDEIDQAAQDIKDMLYKVLDEGAVNDGFGNTIDFSSTTIFLTTNAGDFGIDRGASSIGFSSTDTEDTGTPLTELTREEVLTRLSGHFPDAFLSRIQVAVAFKPLSQAHLAEIAEKMIDERRTRVAERTGLQLEVKPRVGDIFVAQLPTSSRDARTIENALRQLFWPRLGRKLIRVRNRWDRLETLRIEAFLPEQKRLLDVLLLDDEAEREKERITSSGVEDGVLQVVTRNRMDEAEEQVAGHDVVLLDLDWGDGPQDGLQVLKRIRQRGGRDVPVLLYTNHAQHDLRTRYFEEGADGFVPKDQPVLLHQALQNVRRNLFLKELKADSFDGIDWEISLSGSTLSVELSLRPSS
jgi:ATP-dependent Clp protease ATP-binding subunit ClpA/CheY-like chemotaxis protein